jgi:hypothetical protein
MKTRIFLIAAAFAAGTLAQSFGFAVELNVDSSFEGLGTSSNTPLSTGIYYVGWLNAGVTESQIQSLAAAGDLAGIDAVFNQVFSFTDLNSFGNGLPFVNTTLVADGDASGLSAYKNAATGAAGKTMYGWVLNNATIASATQHAFVQGGTFAAANDTVGGTDFASTFATDSFAISQANVWVGDLVSVPNGSGIDTNGGSAVDGAGLNGGENFLRLDAVPEPGTAMMALLGGGVLAMFRRRRTS